MTYDGKVSLGADSIAKYKQFGDKVLEESRETLKKAGITVPVGQSTKKEEDAPIKGFSIEHSDTQSEAPVELPTEAPIEDKDADNDKKSKNESNQNSDPDKKNNYSVSNNAAITDSKHAASNTYDALLAKNSALSNKDHLSPKDMSNQNTVSDFVDVMDDIDDAGQRHIDDLATQYPEAGHFSGGIYTSYEKNSYSKTTIFQGNIENSWQNKSNNFVISGSASFGYEKSKTIKSLDANDINVDESELESAVAEVKTRANDNDDTTADVSASDNDTPQPTNEISKSGNISLKVRLDKKNFIYGGGINSNFSADGIQIHDQNITIMHKSTGLAGDLTRRTTVSKDDETGETIVKSQNKLKISILSRNSDSDNPFAINYDDDNVEKDNSQDLSEKVTENNSEDNATEDENTFSAPEKIIKKDSINPQVKELEDQIAQESNELKAKVKDDSGFNLDFEYDDSNCGITTQYGINLIDKSEKQARFTIAPILGIYDHTPASDDDVESAKLTVGSVVELKKYYDNGNKIDADLSLAVNRIVAQGYRPSDTKYAVLNGTFVNPKKKYSIGVNAAAISNKDTNVKYAVLTANLKAKHSTWGLQAGVTNYNIKAMNLNDTDYQVAVKCTFDLDYKTKK